MSNTAPIVASLAHFARRPTARVVFDFGANVSDYTTAVPQLHSVSNLMGLLLDSSNEQRISAADEHARIAQYLAAFGSAIDIWEVGNEVNGNWLGPASDVVAKLVDACTQAAALGKRTSLTLYDNVGCGDRPAELGPVEYSSQYIPATVRNGLTYVFFTIRRVGTRARRHVVRARRRAYVAARGRRPRAHARGHALRRVLIGGGTGIAAALVLVRGDRAVAGRRGTAIDYRSPSRAWALVSGAVTTATVDAAPIPTVPTREGTELSLPPGARTVVVTVG